MKTTFFLLAFILISFSSFSQDFGAPRRYNVNVEYSSSFSDMYASMLMEKRRAYNEGARKIQNEVDRVASLPAKLWGYENVPSSVSTQTQEYINDLVEVINTSNTDFSNPSHINSIEKHLSLIESKVYEAYRSSKN